MNYSNTLKLMVTIVFKDKTDQISKKVLIKILERMWNFYLSFDEAGFKSKKLI